MPNLQIPKDPYPRNHLRDISRTLTNTVDEMEAIEKRLFDPSLPPDDFAMESTDTQTELIAVRLENLAASLRGWWGLTAHQFAEANP